MGQPSPFRAIKVHPGPRRGTTPAGRCLVASAAARRRPHRANTASGPAGIGGCCEALTGVLAGAPSRACRARYTGARFNRRHLKPQRSPALRCAGQPPLQHASPDLAGPFKGALGAHVSSRHSAHRDAGAANLNAATSPRLVPPSNYLAAQSCERMEFRQEVHPRAAGSAEGASPGPSGSDLREHRRACRVCKRGALP